jgi:hypothetical protein
MDRFFDMIKVMSRIKQLALPLIIVIALIVRLLPNLISPIKTFGYDYGFYLFELRTWQWQGWSSIIGTAWPGYGNLLFGIAHTLHLPSEPFLIISQLLLSIGIVVACYYFWYKENSTAASLAAVLCIISLAQTQLHLMFLWKNLFALIFFVLTLKLIREKRYLLAFAPIALTVISHRTSTIILFIILSCYGLYELIRNRSYKSLGILIILSAATTTRLYPKLHEQWTWFFAQQNSTLTEGALVYLPTYILSGLPLIVISIIGIIHYKNKPKIILLYITGTISLLWIVCGLPFFNRIVPYFDIALILIAAYFIAALATTTSRKIIVGGILVWMILINAIFTIDQSPLITQQEIEEIKSMPPHNPETLVLALSAEDAPWLLGYVPGLRVAAPGLFENKHSYEEWQHFWLQNDEKIFLTRYSRPLILYQRSRKPSAEILVCAPEISPNVLSYECK